MIAVSVSNQNTVISQTLLQKLLTDTLFLHVTLDTFFQLAVGLWRRCCGCIPSRFLRFRLLGSHPLSSLGAVSLRSSLKRQRK